MTTPDSVAKAGGLVGRSFFPFAALTLILGTVWWGPSVTLVAAVALWRLIGRAA